MNLITSIDLHGFKSIKNLNQLQLAPLNVLIGANGAGKSNFISFFKMINQITSVVDNFQLYLLKNGGADDILHDGASITQQITAAIHVETEQGVYEYQFHLDYAVPNTLIFSEEKLKFTNKKNKINSKWHSLGTGHLEPNLVNREHKQAQGLIKFFQKCTIYQFHNTSETAGIKQRWDIEDSIRLRSDGANLAAFLYRLRTDYTLYYQRIVRTIRQNVPFFVDFELEPEFNKLYLRWQERETKTLFGAHQASDGTLRFMALTTLLLQPTELMPNLLILDEPELGLHPYALDTIAGLIQSVAFSRQVIVATQSATFLDYFSSQDVIVVDRVGRKSQFKRLSSEELGEWLEEYSLSELWQKNVLGGSPT